MKYKQKNVLWRKIKRNNLNFPAEHFNSRNKKINFVWEKRVKTVNEENGVWGHLFK